MIDGLGLPAAEVRDSEGRVIPAESLKAKPLTKP
jgi:hypothetical protein